MTINKRLLDIALKATGSISLNKIEEIQSLWSGYGAISRYKTEGGEQNSIVIKHVQLPGNVHHPKGWQSDLSHQRKIRSYHVESAWYQYYSHLCGQACRVPKNLGLDENEQEFLIILEDLNASGFTQRKDTVTIQEMKTCLKWLAYFHATFLNKTPTHLWPVGTYWHLDTRPDELHALADQTLKSVASTIDNCLNACQFKTFVHGDAKLANFCFSENGKNVAAVDFQYVGGGCGMKDVAYFIGSCLHEEDCERYESELLDSYFANLSHALAERHPSINPIDIEKEWRYLYPIAWTDFHRFIKGWSPGHWKIHRYSEKLAQQVIKRLSNQGGER